MMVWRRAALSSLSVNEEVKWPEQLLRDMREMSVHVGQMDLETDPDSGCQNRERGSEIVLAVAHRVPKGKLTAGLEV